MKYRRFATAASPATAGGITGHERRWDRPVMPPKYFRFEQPAVSLYMSSRPVA
jgi:hypothetical protein